MSVPFVFTACQYFSMAVANFSDKNAPNRYSLIATTFNVDRFRARSISKAVCAAASRVFAIKINPRVLNVVIRQEQVQVQEKGGLGVFFNEHDHGGRNNRFNSSRLPKSPPTLYHVIKIARINKNITRNAKKFEINIFERKRERK